MDRIDVIKNHRIALRNLISQYATDNGLSIQIGATTYNDTSFTLLATFVDPKLTDTGGIERRITSFPVDMIHGEIEKRLNKPFVVEHRTFIFVEYTPSNYKYPVIGRSVHGTNHRFPIEVLGTVDIP